MEITNKRNQIAREIITLSRNTLLVNMRFLDASLNMLKATPYELFPTMATDGTELAYNPTFVLQTYKTQDTEMVRDYLHVVFHCIFRHMFISTLIDREYWDLACDIAVENSINELHLKCTNAARQNRQQNFIAEVKEKLKKPTAEKIYHLFLEEGYSKEKIAQIREDFVADDHFIWYERKPNSNGDGNASSDSKNKENNQGGGKSKNNNQTSQGDGSGQDDDNSNNSNGEGNGDFGSASQSRKDVEQRWKDISEKMQQELESFAKQQGFQSGNLVQALGELNRERYDYTAFLKKFATMGEAMKINDDEFDYIFYTYGLKLYKKMPLVEPLEYKEVKRIRDFVIAIDTSGSVSGELVQTFLKKTYNIFKQEEGFFKKFNVHIIQCDADIQEDKKITCQEEFDEYIRTMKLKGFGGTDFRPVFEYVEELRQNKEFTNLKGLIYFTDGWGTFPATQPDYQTAFVFIKEDNFSVEVPTWAIKLVLSKDEI